MGNSNAPCQTLDQLDGWPLVALTTIRQPVEAMARTAARRLVERMTSPSPTPPVHDLLPIHLIQRGTTGPRPPGRAHDA